MRKTVLLSMVLGAVLLLAGCVTEVEKETWHLGAMELPEYPPLARYNLELNLEGKRELVAGSEGALIFSVRNADTVPLRIAEWYANEVDNIRLSCQPWFPGSSEPDENEWFDMDEEIKRPAARFPIEIAPGNKIFIPRNLDFIKGLQVSAEGERRYFIRVELNLSSVKVEPQVFAISVHSAEAMEKRNKK